MTPVRTCVACRVRAPWGQLVRVRAKGAQLVTGSGPGRGAWLGPSTECVALAHRRSALSRALGVEVNADAIARLMESWPSGPSACPHGGG